MLSVIKTELQVGLAWNEREEFIPLQTGEYTQQTTKRIYYGKNSRRFLNLQLGHDVGLIFQHFRLLTNYIVA